MNTGRMPVRIIIIAKAPVPGYAKTRLIPALGAQGAADLARQMLQHAVHIALQADVGPVELCVAPTLADATWPTLKLPSGLAWSEQGEGDLGARMARAARRSLQQGEPVLLIGTDCPCMSAAHLQQAATGLLTHDACLTPTVDGGYALLGLRQFHASLFEHMPWSTPSVARQTQARIAQIPWTLHLLDTLRDVDEPDDLHYLPTGWLSDHSAPPLNNPLENP
jgi:uncharacterized protein